MIDEWSPNRSGFARFSDDRLFRYRLARALTSHGVDAMQHLPRPDMGICADRIVFVLLNPSTADAFRGDRTVDKCVQFAQRWNADVIEVVNIFAFRSTYPADLHRNAKLARPIVGPNNNDEIAAACNGARRIIAAWGVHGHLNGRGEYVREMLARDGMKLETLRLTDDGYPLHPLARGKHHVSIMTEPQPWP
jgi:hypothetical protein